MSERRPTTSPYGSWKSPLDAAALTRASLRLSDARLDGDDVYWLEQRAAEQGRTVLVRRTGDGLCHDVTPPPFNVRSRVHEYGGGAWAVCDGVVVFSNFDDQRLYRVDLHLIDQQTGQPSPIPITPAAALRFADIRIDVNRGALFCVREDHSVVGSQPVNTLVRLRLDGPNVDGGAVLAAGSDFVSSPEVSTDGTALAFLRWNHPNMPWDGTELVVASLDHQGSLAGQHVVAGGPTESIGEPRWAPDGRLIFLSDRSGWWNLYALDFGLPTVVARDLLVAPMEFGRPQFMLGLSSYDFLPNDRLLCSWIDAGYGRLGVLDLASRELTSIEVAPTEALPSEPAAIGFGSVRVSGEVAVLTTSYVDQADAVVVLTPHDDGSQIIRRAGDNLLDPGFISTAEPVTWRNREDATVHGFFYPPANADFTGPPEQRPPLIVLSHGGPTGMATPSFDPNLQYWTTRGFAVLDVNYGGSAGYGRSYRERLRGEWGVVDVDDCVSGAVTMADAGRVDGSRMAIHGGSAGGYTTLAALTFRDVFSAGASYFGISDLETLARDTHKFESHYCDGLVGPYPQARDVYVERSPIHHVSQLNAPMILLQGADDPVVPPDQAVLMAEAVRAKGLPVALLMFEGEGHGFRAAESMRRATEAEAYFYSVVFGFTLADPVDPIPIDNLPA